MNGDVPTPVWDERRTAAHILAEIMKYLRRSIRYIIQVKIIPGHDDASSFRLAPPPGAIQ